MMLKGYFQKTLFFMLITSSLMAIEFSGISINKVGMVPFLLGIYVVLKEEKKKGIYRDAALYVVFLIASCISALIGIIFPLIHREGLINAHINYLIQVIFMYMPMLFFVCSRYGEKYDLKDTFIRQICFIARFHAVWIIAQFVIFSLFGVNISSVLYDDILGGITNANWNSFVYGTVKVIRASGLNRDPAFASYIMMCGYIFDKNRKFNWMYVLCPILAQSRTGFIILIVLVFLDLFQKKYSEKFNKKNLLRILGIIILFIIIILVSKQNDAIVNQMNSIVERITDIFNNGDQDVSTVRHLSYPYLAVRTWGSFSNILYWIFGIGPRTSGLALINNSEAIGFLSLSDTMKNDIWAVESDFAELILGYGLIGFVLYYLILIKFIRNHETRLFGIAIILMSFMYDYSSLSFNMITIIFMFLLMRKNNDINDPTYSN